MSLIFEEETYAIRGAIFEVYKEMGCGFLEAVYQECIEKELRKSGIPFIAQPELQLDNKSLGNVVSELKENIADRCTLSVVSALFSLYAGEIVNDEWWKTEQLRQNVKCDAFIVMPNHFHGIVAINESRRGVLQYAPTTFQLPSQTVVAIVHDFKSATTKQINQLRNTPGQKLWQRNYYKHIIRNENDYNRIYEYIQNNPLKWELDSLHPSNCTGTARRAPTENKQWKKWMVKQWTS